MRAAAESGLLFDAEKTGNMYELVGCAPVYAGMGTDAYIANHDEDDDAHGRVRYSAPEGAGAGGAGVGGGARTVDPGDFGAGAGAGVHTPGRAEQEQELDSRQEDRHLDTFSSTVRRLTWPFLIRLKKRDWRKVLPPSRG